MGEKVHHLELEIKKLAESTKLQGNQLELARIEKEK
jgi:hypothetical protein